MNVSLFKVIIMKFKEAKEFRCSCVYCLEFPNGKKYVGKTKCLRDRLKLYERFGGSSEVSIAIDEFGLDSVDVSILREVICDDVIDLELCLSILEVKYIRDLCSLAPNGLNVSLGGECLGIPVECITTDTDVIKRYNDGSKVVLCYDLCGNFVKEYGSIAKLSYDNGVDEDCIRKYVGKMKPFADKWYLRFKRYDYIPERIEVPVWEVRERVKYKDIIEERVIEKEVTIHTHVPALKYDMNGKFCGEYPSKSAARRTFTKKSGVDWGEYNNGYILFKKVSADYPKQIEDYTVLNKKQLLDYYVPASELPDLDVMEGHEKKPTKRFCVNGKYTNIKHQFKVHQCGLDGRIIATFDSIRDASHETGIAYSMIYNCLNGVTKRAAGYKWKKSEG